ncbi:hypothetical protein BBD39_07355 [Arsenophonus endosymbiont of Bemisia tabaci Asia II 3]|nr:hypothetical protein BBD39_07355 [Arsenophonus endosymbiont of Bemisia tabaci Asia II 3]
MVATVTCLDDYRVKNEVRENAVAEIENGYTRIANELLEELAGANLTKRQFKVVLAVIRKTYGWQKKQDRISNSQLAEITKLPVKRVSETRVQLVEMSILSSKGKLIGINKNVTEWKIPQNKGKSPEMGEHTQNRGKSLKLGDNKSLKTGDGYPSKQWNTKETITKENKYNNIPLTSHEVKGGRLAKPEKRKPHTLNYNDYLVAYNEEVGDRLPHAVEANAKRKTRLKKIVALLASPNLDGWRAYVRAFVGMAKPFYFGENNTGWTADIDYLLRETTLTGVREGKFIDRGY